MLGWYGQWLTTHEPSTEHDLSTGLRDHFDPRARWRSAIGAVRGLHRLASMTKATAAAKVDAGRSASMNSGGWRNGSGVGMDDDDDDDEVVAVGDAIPTAKGAVGSGTATATATDSGTNSPNTFLTAEEEEELQIPGSFDMSNPRTRKGSVDDEGDDDDEDDVGGQAKEDEDASWAGLFKRLGLGT